MGIKEVTDHCSSKLKSVIIHKYIFIAIHVCMLGQFFLRCSIQSFTLRENKICFPKILLGLIVDYLHDAQ